MSYRVDFQWNVGDRVKDKISGMEGIIVSRANHLYGCDRYYISPEGHKDGKPLEGAWFDEHALKLIDAAVHKPVGAVKVAAEPVLASARPGGYDLPDSRR